MQQLNWRENVIRDGLTQRYYIAEEEYRHGSLSWNARPLLAAEVEEIEEMSQKASAAKTFGRIIRVLSEKIESWSEEGDVTVEKLQKIRRPILIKAYEMMAQMRPVDVEPGYEDLDYDDPDIRASGLETIRGSVTEEVGN